MVLPSRPTVTDRAGDAVRLRFDLEDLRRGAPYPHVTVLADDGAVVDRFRWGAHVAPLFELEEDAALEVSAQVRPHPQPDELQPS